MIRFECVNPTTNTDKFWEFDVLTDTEVMFRYGRRGTTGQSMKKSFATFARMQEALEDAVREKLGKGYVPVKTNNMGRTVLPPSSREAAIEAGLSRGIEKQRERDRWEAEKEAERRELAWRREEEQRRRRGRFIDPGPQPPLSVRDLGDPAFTISGGGSGGGGGGSSRGVINAMGAGGAGGGGGGKISLNLENAADAIRGIGEAFETIVRGPGGGVDWGEGFSEVGQRIRGGPRMGQPRRGPCPHPDLSKTSDGYVCRSCGKSVGPAAAPEVATVLTLKVKRKIVLDD